MSACPLLFNTDDELVSKEAPIYRTACQKHGNFLKSLQFSPDGAFTLSATEDNNALIKSLSPDTTSKHAYYSPAPTCEELHPVNGDISDPISAIPIGETIYDLKWFPHNQGTKCFVSTSRDHPIVLWDASSTTDEAAVRCTYRGYDHNDELEAALSLCFNLAGDKLYAGSNRMIRCFDISRPGRDCFSIATTPTKKSPYGQKGLISTIAFNPDYSGAYAAGSFAHSVGIYVENSPECALLLGGLDCGVTCVKWSPCGRYLWVGGRNHSELQCWDIRATQSVVGSVHRKLTSNQRMTFDIDPWGKYLCTGDQDGQILFYDTTTFELMKTVDSAPVSDCSPGSGQNVARSCVNSVQFHPFSALLGVATGERSFAVDTGASDSDADSEDECLSSNARSAAASSGPSTRVAEDSASDESAPKRHKREQPSEMIIDVAPIDVNSGASGEVPPEAAMSGTNSGAIAIAPIICNSCIQIWPLAYTPMVMPAQTEASEANETVVVNDSMEVVSAQAVVVEMADSCEQ